MGLKSVIAEAPILLGTRVRIVELMEYGRKPVRKKRLTQAITSEPRRFQEVLKNPKGNRKLIELGTNSEGKGR